MVSEQHARHQMSRLAVIYTTCNNARTFDAFVDVIVRENRLVDEDVTEAINAMLSSASELRVIPGTVVDFAMRARAMRLRVARANREKDQPGPSVIACGDTCSRCGSMMEYLVSERAVWCPGCRAVVVERTGIDTVKVKEVDSRVLDGEIRLWRERQDQRRQELDAA
jgi:DNA-directed RNA polymerase subunit RPC12/RpoP